MNLQSLYLKSVLVSFESFFVIMLFTIILFIVLLLNHCLESYKPDDGIQNTRLKLNEKLELTKMKPYVNLPCFK